MILDDGGDLTNLVLDNYPELVDGIKVFRRKQPPESIDYMKELKMELYHYLLLM